MKVMLLFALALLALLAARRFFFSFASQTIGDYAETGPKMDIRDRLSGRLISEGVIFGPDGRATSRFVAVMHGTWDGSRGTLSESFQYSEGGNQERLWHLTMTPGGAFTATADDIVGIGKGEQAGAVAHLTYRIRLPEASGGHVLDATDWLYLMDNGTIVNRSEMRKYGVKVAELVATIRPES